jgi:lipopolysaccharide transport system ATP-binding protein
MDVNNAIEVRHVSKAYTLGGAQVDTFRDRLGSMFKKEKRHQFLALEDVSFDIKKGAATAIIGRNGAGKSTVLKLISRITYPTRGYIDISGNVSSLLEVGTGFHPELTGRENVFLNGAILGMSRADIKSKFDQIVDFSGVEKFIDTPVKHYSSGMYVRLAFAVAAHLEPDILIVDEVLAVGDIAFQQKCLGRMKEVGEEGRTVVFVSHNIEAVRSLCEHGIVLHKGSKIFDGPVNEAISSYIDANALNKGNLNWAQKEPYKNGSLSLLAIELLPEKEREFITIGEGFTLKFRFAVSKPVNKPHVTFQLATSEGVMLFNASSLFKSDALVSSCKSTFEASCIFPPHLLNEGNFVIAKLVVIDEYTNILFEAQHCFTFEVKFDPESVFGLKGRKIGPFKPLLNWTIVNND